MPYTVNINKALTHYGDHLRGHRKSATKKEGWYMLIIMKWAFDQYMQSGKDVPYRVYPAYKWFRR
jgi:hypothetical protein